MHVARLAHETDFAGWRRAARALRAANTPPEAVLWTVDGGAELSASDGEGVREPQSHTAAPFTVPREFVELAEQVILHRSDERFALLYRLLWRLQDVPGLLQHSTDPEVSKARDFSRAVSRAAHKMKAFVRFREATDANGAEACVAWFEPSHRVTEDVAPFFVRRFASMRFSILTPDACAHWDLKTLAFTPGADAADAPRQDALEDYWRTHYAAIFRRRGNPPEAAAIPRGVVQAETAARQMVRAAPTQPSPRAVKAVLRANRDAPYDGLAPQSLDEVAAGVDVCKRCDLWRDATQGVPGQGPARARLMFVGEQPGDQEDLAGLPFVGPAGQVLDKALAEAGVPRAETFVTNAVKHFKYELRGKRRIHQTPNSGEVAACRWWLDAERRLVRPRVVVALGATAGLSVFGKPTPIGKFRQQALQLPDQAQGVVTYHPSYLLRVPDAAAKAKAYALFVEDLKFAWRLAA